MARIKATKSLLVLGVIVVGISGYVLISSRNHRVHSKLNRDEFSILESINAMNTLSEKTITANIMNVTSIHKVRCDVPAVLTKLNISRNSTNHIRDKINNLVLTKSNVKMGMAIHLNDQRVYRISSEFYSILPGKGFISASRNRSCIITSNDVYDMKCTTVPFLYYMTCGLGPSVWDYSTRPEDHVVQITLGDLENFQFLKSVSGRYHFLQTLDDLGISILLLPLYEITNEENNILILDNVVRFFVNNRRKLSTKLYITTTQDQLSSRQVIPRY
uniref:Uncharacterized protein LOC100368550 n=1 Tax=Saccoglossus kowalevskii TaxID=10224 RepID=A0ABM0H1E6_SACKO|nr:PREDICTED: uncharacterized protein LOC100368550 [Saccoglossus kowalevskii]